MEFNTNIMTLVRGYRGTKEISHPVDVNYLGVLRLCFSSGLTNRFFTYYHSANYNLEIQS